MDRVNKVFLFFFRGYFSLSIFNCQFSLVPVCFNLKQQSSASWNCSVHYNSMVPIRDVKPRVDLAVTSRVVHPGYISSVANDKFDSACKNHNGSLEPSRPSDSTLPPVDESKTNSTKDVWPIMESRPQRRFRSLTSPLNTHTD